MKNVQFNLIKKAPFQCRRGISGGGGDLRCNSSYEVISK